MNGRAVLRLDNGVAIDFTVAFLRARAKRQALRAEDVATLSYSVTCGLVETTLTLKDGTEITV